MRLIALALLLAAPAAHAQTVTTEGDGSRTLVVEALVPAPPEAVWRSVSTAEGWKSWAVPAAWLSGDILETAYDPAAKPGDPGNIQQRFTERAAPRSLVFRTVKAPAGFPHAQAFMRVTHFLLLRPEAGGTRVQLTDRGYPAGPEGDELLAFFKTGNQQTLDHLVARHGLAPLDFLVGHCWRGVVAEGIDMHCFKAADGKILDHHEVVAEGKTVYAGDTVYAWSDGAAHWTYTSSDHGTMKGEVRGVPAGLDFGTADFVAADGTKLTMTTRWIHAEGADAYMATVETAGHIEARRYKRAD